MRKTDWDIYRGKIALHESGLNNAEQGLLKSILIAEATMQFGSASMLLAFPTAPNEENHPSLSQTNALDLHVFTHTIQLFFSFIKCI